MRYIPRRALVLWALISVFCLLALAACTTRPPSSGEFVPPSVTLPDGTPVRPQPPVNGETMPGADPSEDTAFETDEDGEIIYPDPGDIGLPEGYRYLYGPSELAGVSAEGIRCQTKEEDGVTYMRYRATADNAGVMLVSAVQNGSLMGGRYVRIKYRSSAVSVAKLTIGQEMLTAQGVSTVCLMPDDQWRVVTVDLYANRCCDERIDLLCFGFDQKGKSMDVEWIAVYPDDGAPHIAYDPLAGLPSLPREDVDLSAYSSTLGGSAHYKASGYIEANEHTFTVRDGFHMDVSRRRYFNRYTLVYSASSPLVGEVTYLYWDKDKEVQTGRETFYLEAGENQIFSSLIDGYFDDIYAYAITGVDLKTCKGDTATFTLTDISSNMAPVFASGSYYLENERYRVGILLAWGGGISYIEDKWDGDDSLGNLINRADPGRLVQQSYYGVQNGPAYEAGMYGDTLWRYNPVQGGDLYGNASKLVDFSLSEDGKSIYIKCRPMDWAKKGELTPSYMENTYTVELEGIYVDNRFVDFFGVEHGAHHFELPAFYTISYLGTFHYYDGNRPWTNDDYRTLENEPFWGGNKDAYHPVAAGNTETWAAWTADNGYGIGLYTPGAEILLAGRHEANGSKDPTNTGTSYVAPLRTMEIVSYQPFEYRYVIATGWVEEMREVFAAYANQN